MKGQFASNELPVGRDLGYAYDAAHRWGRSPFRSEADPLGRVVAQVDDAGYTSYTWDMSGQSASKELPVSRGQGYAYDAAGRRAWPLSGRKGLRPHFPASQRPRW